MKLTPARMTLVAGLAMALQLTGSVQIQAAGITTKIARAQPRRLADAQADPPTPNAPSVSPTPLVPTPDPFPGQAAPADALAPQGTSPVTTVPLQLGTQPSLTPPPRPPMGLLYGEQERLDAMTNPSPKPLAPTNPPGSAPVYEYPPNESLPSGVLHAPTILGAPEIVGPHQPMVDRFGMAPPPGTLGQTYRRRSRPIEETKHPRIGAVEVNLPEEVDVTAKGLKPKWTGKVWRLESDSLIPGIPHIYEIKASWGEGTQPQYRTVRLIMGRIVDLDF